MSDPGHVLRTEAPGRKKKGASMAGVWRSWGTLRSSSALDLLSPAEGDRSDLGFAILWPGWEAALRRSGEPAPFCPRGTLGAAVGLVLPPRGREDPLLSQGCHLGFILVCSSDKCS